MIKEAADEVWQILNWPMQAILKERDSSQFWAVIIGIENYPHHHIYGCVSDAELMEKYLIENLRVPSDHIQRLLGPSGENTSNQVVATILQSCLTFKPVVTREIEVQPLQVLDDLISLRLADLGYDRVDLDVLVNFDVIRKSDLDLGTKDERTGRANANRSMMQQTGRR
ncbi:hypothetical protein EV421DRAFT_2018398 [Armillaria borealis]|uniref:Uncharacterized protein n=1 Tax=Armillaria borealis TaxID=47425 RepID=A0AA39MT82_9AGAR|nr:hypothetical protein EV421DRAFT_2018398 [Armillaria borealis]